MDLNFHTSDMNESLLNDSDDTITEGLTLLNESSQVTPYSERLETYIVPVVFAIIFIVGVMGNGTLVTIFARNRVIRNAPNIYILNLALGDLLVIVTCVPFTSMVYTIESWPFGLLICKISEFTKDVSIGVSVFTLTALSADRYFAIVDPLRNLHSSVGGRGARKFTIGVTISIWLLSILFAAPAAVFSYERAFIDQDVVLFKACYPYPDWIEGYGRKMVMIRFFIYFALPLTIITIFYVPMSRYLFRSVRILPGETRIQMNQIKARQKVAKTVLAFVLIFAFCFLPQHMYMLWFYYNSTAQQDYNAFWHVFRIVGFCLTFSNSCINPIALYFISGTFRQYFDDYLNRCFRCQEGSRRRRCSTMERSNRYAGSSTYRDNTRIGCGNGYGYTQTRRMTTMTTSNSLAIQMSTLTRPDPILKTERTVTSLLNGLELEDQLI